MTGTSADGVVMTGGFLQMQGNEVFTKTNTVGHGVKITGSGSHNALIKGNRFSGDANSNYTIKIDGTSEVKIEGNDIKHGGIYCGDGTCANLNIGGNQLEEIYTNYDYTPASHQLILKGICKKCSKKQNEKNTDKSGK